MSTQASGSERRDTLAPAPACAPAVHRPWFPAGRTIGDRPCDAPCPESARPFVLAATILGSAMAFIDGTIVHIALPAIQRDLGADFSALQWVVNGYALLLGALILIGGALGDRIGRKRVYLIGVSVFAVASLACALAPTTPSLIAARAVQGVGAALLVPQSLAIIAASFPVEVRGRAIGIWAGFAALTTAAGPIAGGALIDFLSWRAAFWVNLPLAALTLWLTWRFVLESRDAHAHGGTDILGAVLAVAGLGLLTFGLTALPERDSGSLFAAAIIVGGVAVLGAFALAESQVRSPMMPLRLFRSLPFSAANTITLLLYFALGGVIFLLPFNLIQMQGYSALNAGLALLPFGIIMGLFSGAAGRLADSTGPRLPLVAGPAIVALACAGLAVPAIDPDYWTTFFAPIVLLAIGMTIAVAPLTTAVMNAVDENQSGVASGINNAASRLAGLIAVAVTGALAAAVFAGRLESALAAISLPPQSVAELLAGANQLAGLAVPAGLEAATASAVAMSIDSAFLGAFRGAMIVSALAAGLAAVSAFVFLTAPAGKPPADAAAPAAGEISGR